MAKIAAVSFVATLAVLGLANQALSQGQCFPREVLVEILGNKYGETLQSAGLAENNAVFEMFASEETGTWTIVRSTADGVSCPMASGQAYSEFDIELEPAGMKL